MMKFTLRVPKGLYDQLKEVAKREKRSLAGQIIYMLQQQLDEQKGKEK